LLKARRSALDLIHNTYFQGTLLEENPNNADLQFGPDFGGNSPAKLLDAINLYQGRFYSMGLGPQGINSLLESKHHTLILSGLYGIVSPSETIQLYECKLEDLRPFYNNWTQDNLLTYILIDYIDTNGITTVVDLTSQNTYRNLINWELLNQKTGLNVLHAHCQKMAGPQALPDIGFYLKKYLLNMSSKDFQVFRTKVENHCCLTISKYPPNGWPIEERELLDFALQEGETKTREFKENITGASTKETSLQTITAFLNTEGGELIVGVQDNPIKVIGIRKDLERYNQSLDQYINALELRVRNRIVTKKSDGTLFLLHLAASIWKYKNIPILTLTVIKSTNAAYLTIKGGNETEFWVRSLVGNKRLDKLQEKEYLKGRADSVLN